MFFFYLTMLVFVMVCVFLILLILIQKGRGGGLASAFGGGGGNTAFGSKTGDVLTWTTAIAFGVFVFLAMALGWETNSIHNKTVGPAVSAVTPVPVAPASDAGEPALPPGNPNNPAIPPGAAAPLPSTQPAPTTKP